MKRPTFLTIWLIIIIVANLLSLFTYAFAGSFITKSLPGLPSWYLPVADILLLVNIVAAVMIWLWKKYGFYIIVASSACAFIMNIIILGISGVGSALFGLIGVGILYLAMRPVWNNFK